MWKMLQCGFFSGLPFPKFRLNMDIYSVNLRIQSEYKETIDQEKLCIWTISTQYWYSSIGIFWGTSWNMISLLTWILKIQIVFKSVSNNICEWNLT